MSTDTTVHEEAREVPVIETCDVCVVGGSCTGVFAAIRAAQLGAKVCCVENNGFFGGMATAGIVSVWHTLYDIQGQQQIIAGLTDEVLTLLQKRKAVVERGNPPRCNFAFNPAELIIELDELVKEHGVRPFLHTRFVQPIMEDGRVVAAVVEDKTGRRAIRASMFIDATGDGDLIARAGLSFRQLDDLQPPTMCAFLHGLEEVGRQNQGFSLSAVVHDPRYPEALKRGFLWSAPVPGVPDLTMVAGTRAHHADCSDADQLTQASIETRRQVRAMCDILRKYIPGGDAVGLAALPAHLGIRETRHADCLHTLTEEEVLHGQRFEDAIGNGTYPADVHHSSKPGITFRHLDGHEIYSVPGQPQQVGRWRPEQDEDPAFYQIPYRSLVPRGAKNVLVAGRLIDADRRAYGAIRVMVNCNQTGEAAGVAAWLALDSGREVTEIDTAKLRDILRKFGAAIV